MKKYCWIVVFGLSMAGCAPKQAPVAATASPESGRAVQSANGVQGEIDGTPAPGSRFAKLRIGMPMKQVIDLIGQPNDTDAHITGKSFIPFYFGGDSVRSEAFYRNEGYLTYSAGHFAGAPTQLIAIHVNRAETGYAH